MQSQTDAHVELTILILTLDEAGNIGTIVGSAAHLLEELAISSEILIVDGGSRDGTREVAEAAGARVIVQSAKGYASGLLQGFREARGKFIITLDGDLSHPTYLIPLLYKAREEADVIVGSRWMRGGGFEGPWLRKLLSQFLNLVFRRVLTLPVHDLSSGYRLYRSSIISSSNYTSRDFSILQEVLVKSYSEGYVISEIPLIFKRRKEGVSHVRFFRFAYSYLVTLARMWFLRNDAGSCDYDSRAYDSWVLPQRYWQRARFKNIMELLGDYRTHGSVLDIGCGSSRIIQALPHAVAYDLSAKKLRYLRKSNSVRVLGSALSLPFKNATFDCVIHSQLIEHLPPHPDIFSELSRIIKPGGRLIIGTVDYGSWTWPWIEWLYGILLPHAYASEHITHYTLDSLKERLKEFGFRPESVRTILKGEITIMAEKI